MLGRACILFHNIRPSRADTNMAWNEIRRLQRAVRGSPIFGPNVDIVCCALGNGWVGPGKGFWRFFFHLGLTGQPVSSDGGTGWARFSEAIALDVAPWVAIFLVSSVAHMPILFTQVCFYILILIGGGFYISPWRCWFPPS